ncbi:hypothetical protein WJX81_004446 [Elliptochloris bilobata]|uniref:Uncharacterized protein n=1 Tax=Elliptochloris bilobata TaxID=381761 RepID=A0AAW1S856_9CHLO
MEADRARPLIPTPFRLEDGGFSRGWDAPHALTPASSDVWVRLSFRGEELAPQVRPGRLVQWGDGSPFLGWLAARKRTVTALELLFPFWLPDLSNVLAPKLMGAVGEHVTSLRWSLGEPASDTTATKLLLFRARAQNDGAELLRKASEHCKQLRSLCLDAGVANLAQLRCLRAVMFESIPGAWLNGLYSLTSLSLAYVNAPGLLSNVLGLTNLRVLQLGLGTGQQSLAFASLSALIALTLG